ncbi:hypothetical protein KVR01_004144 [Diaporthe batatas]|uniref:uncharacterized protein n=1 Tax=Diaporthe batatas TaxID=748121 RepID=UPI001D0490A9|nr:uncharacterized protein KVR01_004144 [Diaporthe batatas]KAG8165592.1 hypothetical protein KVR01_004144 [Diaporthe batatas]
MAYVPPALRKKAQASSPDGPPGTTAEAAGSRENLPPGSTAPWPAAEPLFSQGDISSHYWDPQDEGKRLAESPKGTLNASAQEPDRLKYVMLFRDANPRWESHGVIFVKSKLHILPGGERFREEQLDGPGGPPAAAGEPVGSGRGRGDRTHESGNPTGGAGALADEVPGEKSPVEEAQASDESQTPTHEHLGIDKQDHGRSTGPSEDAVKKQRPANNNKTKNNKDPSPEPEPPYSPDLTLYPLDPIAVFEQAQGGHGRFRFAGYHRIASLEYLPPHSRELIQLLDQKWTTTDRRGRVRQAQRSAESWKGSLRHRWAVIQMERDHEADGRLGPPGVEVRPEAGGASSGKSVRELLAEMRLKG